MILLLALLIGVIAGLRAMLAPAAISWAGYLHGLNLSGSWLAFLGYTWTLWVLSFAALAELVDRSASIHAKPQGAAAVRCESYYGRPERRGNRCSLRRVDRRSGGRNRWCCGGHIGRSGCADVAGRRVRQRPPCRDRRGRRRYSRRRRDPWVSILGLASSSTI